MGENTMIIVPLGIASATPTAMRHLPSVALWRNGNIFLFDCGENTQMRMLQAGLKRSKIDSIFISHFDVDHYSGLMGLLSTLQLQRREKEINIVGPVGIKEYVEWNLNFSGVVLSFEINFVEVAEDVEEHKVIEKNEYYVIAMPLKHKRFCLGYRFQEKDKPGKVDASKAGVLGITSDKQYKELKAGNTVKLEDGREIEADEIIGHPRPGDSFAYITDTEYCPNAVKLAMNTNILYHEATFSSQLPDKAKETGHSTSLDAARVASEAQTKLLVIGHFSARYTNLHVLLEETREAFFPTWLANELRPIFTDPTRERGIVNSKVELKDLTRKEDFKSNYGRGRHTGRDHRSGRRDYRGSSGNRNFRQRKQHSAGRYDNDRSSGYRFDNDRAGYRNSGGGYRGRQDTNSNRVDRRYTNSNFKHDKKSGEKMPSRSNSPRTSYDDFDRF